MNDKNDILLRVFGAVDPGLAADADPALAPPRRRPRIAAIAALAAAAALLIAAGFGFPTRFRTLTGLDYRVLESQPLPEGWSRPGWHGAGVAGDIQPPVTVEDGKLYFTLDGQHLDLTGLADQETPYIYTTINAGMSGGPVYVMVGGTAAHYGFAESWYSPAEDEVVLIAGHGGADVTEEMPAWSTVWLTPSGDLGSRLEGAFDDDMPCLYPWLVSAMEQLQTEGKLP